MNIKSLKSLFFLCAIVLLTVSCSTISESKVEELNWTADKAHAKLILEFPKLRYPIDTAPGYLVLEHSGYVLPMFGARTIGVLVDNLNNDRTVVYIPKLEVDGARGLSDFTGFIIMPDAESVELAKTDGLIFANRGVIYLYSDFGPIADYPLIRMSIVPES